MAAVFPFSIVLFIVVILDLTGFKKLSGLFFNSRLIFLDCKFHKLFLLFLFPEKRSF